MFRLYKQCLCNRLGEDNFPFSASDLVTQLCFLWNKKKQNKTKQQKTGLSYLQLAVLALISRGRSVSSSTPWWVFVRNWAQRRHAVTVVRRANTYYSSCMLGLHIVACFLPGLFEALLGHFDPERKTTSKHQSSCGDKLIYIVEIHCFTIIKRPSTDIPALTIPVMVLWYLHTMILVCQSASPPTLKWLTGLLLHAQSRQCHYSFVHLKDKWSAS